MEIRPLTIGYDKMVSCMNDVILWIANQESFLFKNMRMSIAVLVIIYILLSLIYWGLKFQKNKISNSNSIWTVDPPMGCFF